MFFLLISSNTLFAAKENQISNLDNIPQENSTIRQYYLYISREDSITLYTRDVWSKEYLRPGRFVFNGIEYNDVMFRFRGNFYGRGGSGDEMPNKSFKIKFPNERFEGQTRNLDLNVIWLYNGQGGVYRSKLPMDVLKIAGYPVPETRWCEFFLNDVYMGLFMEQEEIDSGPFLQKWFGTENGNIYKLDKVLTDSLGHRRFWREINTETNVDWSDFYHFMEVIEYKDKNLFWREIEKIVDIPSFLKFAALHMLCSVIDLYDYGRYQDWDKIRTHEVVENALLYHHPGLNKFVLLPWDNNVSLTRTTNLADIFPGAWDYIHIVGYIIDNPPWRQEYQNLYRKYLSTFYTVENMNNMIDLIYNETKDAMVRHNNRWKDIYGFYDLDAEREQMKNFVIERINFIESSLSPPLIENEYKINTIVINEINYNSSNDFDPGDWVELYNVYDIPVDISGWVFKDEDDTHAFMIPENTLIAAGDYLVLCRDDSLFHSAFPEVDNYIGNFGFGLNNSGETVRLFNYLGGIIDSLTYYDEAPWPVDPDGNGPALALRDPTLYNTLPENWASSGEHGTPGEINDVYTGIDERAQLEVPIAFSLGQNYPNPFNSVTTIPFSVSMAGRVTIEVYSILGQLAEKIMDENMTPGHHYVVFKSENLPSGLYLYTIKAGNYNKTRQMVLMK